MALLERVPTEIEEKFRKAAASDLTPIHMAFPTDLSNRGDFGNDWFIITGMSVARISGTSATESNVISLPTMKSARSDMMAGCGILRIEVDIDGEAHTVDLLSFTNSLTGKINAVVRYLSALADGEPPNIEEIQEKATCPRCGRLLPADSDTCDACVNKRAVMIRLFQFLRPYKLQVTCGLIILVFFSFTELVPPYVGGRIIDVLVNERGNPSLAMLHLWKWVGLLAVIRLIASSLQYGQRRFNSWIGAKTLMDIRIALFRKFSNLSLGYYDKRSTGSVMARITNDADNLWDFLMDGAPWFVSNILTLSMTSLVLFRMNAHLAVMLLLPGPLIVLLTRWFLPRTRARFRMVWHRISRMYSSLNSAISGMRVIKAFAQEEKENKKFEQRNFLVFEASYQANAMWAVYFPVLALLMGAGSWIIWLVGGYSVIYQGMTLGMLTAFAGYLIQFYAPFQNFTRAMDWSTRSLTAAERVFEVLDTEPDVRESQESVAMPHINGAVEFRGVSFSYDKNRRVLDNFSLTVRPGEMIGLVGHSGAGKSTIINLLSRFYDVTEGSILIDGVDIRDIKQEDLRRQLGIVLQDSFLFPGSIKDNIAYAKPDATPEEIMRAAKAANCHNFILKFPDGYDTYVGERGQRLSGGERQRISIARAILHDPKILILDEATASVDTETEKLIQEAIERLIQNRTTFAIAHRLSTLRDADRLVVMKAGKIEEVGTHDELMDHSGIYAGLVKIQTHIRPEESDDSESES